MNIKSSVAFKATAAFDNFRRICELNRRLKHCFDNQVFVRREVRKIYRGDGQTRFKVRAREVHDLKSENLRR